MGLVVRCEPLFPAASGVADYLEERLGGCGCIHTYIYREMITRART